MSKEQVLKTLIRNRLVAAGKYRREDGESAVQKIYDNLLRDFGPVDSFVKEVKDPELIKDLNERLNEKKVKG